MARYSRRRVILVDHLDRQMAESRAIGRAITAGARWARVLDAERVLDPDSETPVWQITLAVSRRRAR